MGYKSHQFINGPTYKVKQVFTLTVTVSYRLFRDADSPNLCVSGLWEKARVDGENPCRHKDQKDL